jgi:hypothetical protein
MAPKTDDNFFSEQEEKAQEELEKIKVGENEYEPKEIEDYIAKGKKVDEYQKKYNTDFDKAWSSYGKTTQENKALKEQLEQLQSQTQQRQSTQVGELSDEQIAQAREQAKKIGIVTQGDLDSWYQSRRSAEKLLEECKGYEGEIKGDDGRPKFDSEEILNHMAETGIKNPLKAYKDKYETELDAWKQSELNKEKGSSLPTLTTTTSVRQPKSPTVTKDNIGQLIREQIWGAEANE